MCFELLVDVKKYFFPRRWLDGWGSRFPRLPLPMLRQEDVAEVLERTVCDSRPLTSVFGLDTDITS